LFEGEFTIARHISKPTFQPCNPGLAIELIYFPYV
jgi:hypothetical protein